MNLHLYGARQQRRAADVLVGGRYRHAGNERRHRKRRASRRQRVDELTVHDALARLALHVHERRLARDGDRLLDGSDAHLGIHRGGEGASEDQSVASDGIEARQRERKRVGPGRQHLHAILTRAIGHDRAHFLDECRTRRFHRDARQHGSGRILHLPGDRRLGVRRCRKQGATRENSHECRNAVHRRPPLSSRRARTAAGCCTPDPQSVPWSSP